MLGSRQLDIGNRGQTAIYVMLALGIIWLLVGCGGSDSDGGDEGGDPDTIFYGSVPPLDPIDLPEALPVPSEGSSAYELQESFEGICEPKPRGMVCVQFTDGYIWIVSDNIVGRSSRQDEGKQVEIAIGLKFFYYHVPSTTSVRQVSR